MQKYPMADDLRETLRLKLTEKRRELRRLGPNEPPSEFERDPTQSRAIDARDQERTHLRNDIDRLEGWLDEDAILRECYRKAGA
jgi:hypothetical protein